MARTKIRYGVIDDRTGEMIQTFATKRECRFWLMEGVYSCEGAERDHYVNMLAELDGGKKTLRYWQD